MDGEKLTDPVELE